MNHVYAYSLKPEPFRAFLDGYKRVEMRLFDEKRRLLKPGDFLRFENEDNPEEHFLFEVTALVRFPSFQELYAAYRPEEIGYHPETAPSYRDMERYYPEEKIRQYGALAIEGTMVEEEGGSPLLFTERLVLRPFQKGDAPAMYAGWCNDEEVADGARGIVTKVQKKPKSICTTSWGNIPRATIGRLPWMERSSARSMRSIATLSPLNSVTFWARNGGVWVI
jgi:ASC-1-like (ASCH) protein